MENLNKYTLFAIHEFELCVLLPTDNVDLYSDKTAYSFYLTKNAHLIINGIDYGDGLITINKRDGHITAGCMKQADVSARLVDEFISQNPDLNCKIATFLKKNPHDLFKISSGSSIMINPMRWIMASQRLDNGQNIGPSVGETMSKKFYDLINCTEK